ncbi:hypothetical protein [Bacillus sp. REN16]|uniref:hypothetical protein n=1 Tax=Bacillus sp. REN16 TaxID=2887296 RepID=UPI001E5E4AF3|nr:hypothetical protein [Bacillus sp. REN16]MCC3359243.1 hypothetical protein [Bacillus sp. REN16]
MFFFNKEDVYIGYSMEELSKVRDQLESKGIKYKYNVINGSGKMLGRGTTRGNFGSIGINNNYEKQYVVSVREKDYESAKYWIDKVLHS